MIFNLLKDGMLNALSQGLYRFSILLLFFLHVKQFGDNALYTTIIMILLTFQAFVMLKVFNLIQISHVGPPLWN